MLRQDIFFFFAYRFGATGRNVPQWPPDNHNLKIVGSPAKKIPIFFVGLPRRCDQCPPFKRTKEDFLGVDNPLPIVTELLFANIRPSRPRKLYEISSSQIAKAMSCLCPFLQLHGFHFIHSCKVCRILARDTSQRVDAK